MALWALRHDAESDALASVALDPTRLWPTLQKSGIGLSCFDWEPHRVLFCIFDQHRHNGVARCLSLAIKYWDWQRWHRGPGDTLEQVFDRFPPSAANVTHQAARLRDLLSACRDAQRHLALAKHAVEIALDRAALPPLTIQPRSAGGKTNRAVHYHTVTADIAKNRGLKAVPYSRRPKVA